MKCSPLKFSGRMNLFGWRGYVHTYIAAKTVVEMSMLTVTTAAKTAGKSALPSSLPSNYSHN
jgi:hypothetical protein